MAMSSGGAPTRSDEGLRRHCALTGVATFVVIIVGTSLLRYWLDDEVDRFFGIPPRLGKHALVAAAVLWVISGLLLAVDLLAARMAHLRAKAAVWTAATAGLGVCWYLARRISESSNLLPSWILVAVGIIAYRSVQLAQRAE